MKNKPRWMLSAIETSKEPHPALPYQRETKAVKVPAPERQTARK